MQKQKVVIDSSLHSYEELVPQIQNGQLLIKEQLTQGTTSKSKILLYPKLESTEAVRKRT